MSRFLIFAGLLLLAFCATCTEGGFLKARYRRNMAIGEDGEDERVMHQKLHRRQKEKIEDPNPPMLPVEKKSRSYHFSYGPLYPTHHRHLRNQYFPLPKNQLLHP